MARKLKKYGNKKTTKVKSGGLLKGIDKVLVNHGIEEVIIPTSLSNDDNEFDHDEEVDEKLATKTEAIVGNDDDNEVDEDEIVGKRASCDMLEQIMFNLPYVDKPLMGTPKKIRKELDDLVLKMQKHPNNNKIFNKIHHYMHIYLVGLVLKKFPFIKGYQSVDIYQESLISLRFKAIPKFKMNKGMSFLNFAKMCIRRHLITLLNTSKNRKKDQSMNRAVSIDSSPFRNSNDDGNKATYANILPDAKCSADEAIETSEAYNVTKKNLFRHLSEFERVVLSEYLSSSSYKEMSSNISRIIKRKYNIKSIDNALWRIRKKAVYLLKHTVMEDLPIFLVKKE